MNNNTLRSNTIVGPSYRGVRRCASTVLRVFSPVPNRAAKTRHALITVQNRYYQQPTTAEPPPIVRSAEPFRTRIFVSVKSSFRRHSCTRLGEIIVGTHLAHDDRPLTATTSLTRRNVVNLFDDNTHSSNESHPIELQSAAVSRYVIMRYRYFEVLV